MKRPFRLTLFPLPGLRLFLLAAALLALGACVPMLHFGPAPTRLQLNPAMPQSLGGAPVNRQVIVSSPSSGRDIDTDRVALLFNAREVRYLADTRWTSPIPQLVHGLLIDALESTGGLGGVADDLSGLTADVRLLTEIKQFHLRYASEKSVPVAVFQASFRLLDLRNGQIIGATTVEAEAPAPDKSGPALAGAMESALSKALAQAAPWVVDRMRTLR